MKTQDFIDILKKENISCKIDFTPNDDVIISVLGNINLNVYLKSIESLPENTQFNNGGSVYLYSLKSLSENIWFNNIGNVNLRLLTSLPENPLFNNGGYVYLNGKKLEPKEYVFPVGNKRKNEVKDLYKILLKFFEYNYPVYSGSSIICKECESEYWLTGQEFKANIDNGLRKVFIHKSTCMTHDKLMKELN